MFRRAPLNSPNSKQRKTSHDRTDHRTSFARIGWRLAWWVSSHHGHRRRITLLSKTPRRAISDSNPTATETTGSSKKHYRVVAASVSNPLETISPFWSFFAKWKTRPVWRSDTYVQRFSGHGKLGCGVCPSNRETGKRPHKRRMNAMNQRRNLLLHQCCAEPILSHRSVPPTAKA